MRKIVADVSSGAPTTMVVPGRSDQVTPRKLWNGKVDQSGALPLFSNKDFVNVYVDMVSFLDKLQQITDLFQRKVDKMCIVYFTEEFWSHKCQVKTKLFWSSAKDSAQQN